MMKDYISVCAVYCKRVLVPVNSFTSGFKGSNQCDNPTIVGTSGDDILIGTNGPNVLSGFEGNDTIYQIRLNDFILVRW